MVMGQIRIMEAHTVVAGSGAAGFNAADRLRQYGVEDVVLVTENINAGTSRNTGSDKQTYYKLSLAGGQGDSVRRLAECSLRAAVWTVTMPCARQLFPVRDFLSWWSWEFLFPTTGTGSLWDTRQTMTPMTGGPAWGPTPPGI